MSRIKVLRWPETVTIEWSLFGWGLNDQDGYAIGKPVPMKYPEQKPSQHAYHFKTPIEAMRFSDRHFGTRFCDGN